MNAQRLQQPSNAAWSPHESFLAILTLVAAWDASKANKRLRAVYAFTQGSPFLEALSEKGLVKLQIAVAARIGEAGGSALEQACAALPLKMQASVYAVCADILGVNGALSGADRGRLDELGMLLHVDPVLASQIETVILLKNRF